MAQRIQYSSRKHQALNSNPRTTKKIKGKKSQLSEEKACSAYKIIFLDLKLIVRNQLPNNKGKETWIFWW
jgi:hypothetical protein